MEDVSEKVIKILKNEISFDKKIIIKDL